MGQIAMPSPTPSASEPSYSFAYSDSVGALPPTTMNSFDGLYTGRWGYDTPPLDEACVYGVDTKIEPGEDQYQQLQQLQLPQEDSVESSVSISAPPLASP